MTSIPLLFGSHCISLKLYHFKLKTFDLIIRLKLLGLKYYVLRQITMVSAFNLINGFQLEFRFPELGKIARIARNYKARNCGQVKSTLKPIGKPLETHWKPIGISLETCWKPIGNY